MSDLSHESREVLRLHTEALNKFTAEITDFVWKIEHGDLFYDFNDSVHTFESAVISLKQIKND